MSSADPLPLPIRRLLQDALASHGPTQVAALEALAIWFRFKNRPTSVGKELYDVYVPADLQALQPVDEINDAVINLVLEILSSTTSPIVRRRAMDVLCHCPVSRVFPGLLGFVLDWWPELERENLQAVLIGLADLAWTNADVAAALRASDDFRELITELRSVDDLSLIVTLDRFGEEG